MSLTAAAQVTFDALPTGDIATPIEYTNSVNGIVYEIIRKNANGLPRVRKKAEAQETEFWTLAKAQNGDYTEGTSRVFGSDLQVYELNTALIKGGVVDPEQDPVAGDGSTSADWVLVGGNAESLITQGTEAEFTAYTGPAIQYHVSDTDEIYNLIDGVWELQKGGATGSSTATNAQLKSLFEKASDSTLTNTDINAVFP